MSIDRILQLKLVADVGNINTALSGVEAKTSKLGSAFKTLTSFAGPVAINAAITGATMLAEALQGGAEDARKFDEAVSGLAGTLAPLGIGAAAAQALADSAAAAGAALGFADDDVVVRGLQAFAEQTQSATEAQDLLAAAMDLSRLKGIDLESAVAKVQGIYKGSARTLAEFGVSGVSGMAAVTAALGDNTTAAEDWATTTQGRYATAAAAIDDVFQTAGAAINTAMDSFILPAFAELIPKLGELWAKWQPTLAAITAKLGEFFAWVAPLFQGLGAIASGIFDAILLTLDTIVLLLNGDFSGAWEKLKEVVNSVWTGITEGVGALLGFLGSIVPTFLQIAGNIGKAIWDGITGALAGLADAITRPVRDGLNTIIGAWNSFEIPAFGPFRIGEGTIFDTGNIGPFGPWGLPDITPLASGGIVSKPTLSLIGEAGPEAVIPLGHGGGMGGVNITINVGVGDPAAIGAAVTKVLRAYRNAGGGPAIRAAVG